MSRHNRGEGKLAKHFRRTARLRVQEAIERVESRFGAPRIDTYNHIKYLEEADLYKVFVRTLYRLAVYRWKVICLRRDVRKLQDDATAARFVEMALRRRVSDFGGAEACEHGDDTPLCPKCTPPTRPYVAAGWPRGTSYL